MEWNHDSTTGVMTVRKVTAEEIESEMSEGVGAKADPPSKARRRKG